MRIRIIFGLLLTAIAAVGCSSFQHNQNPVARGGTGEYGLGSEPETAYGSESGLPDYRQILADPGPF